MAQTQNQTRATRQDVKDVLGNLDDEKLTAVLAAQPTIRDLEEAAVWLAGDRDVFGAGEPLKGAASRIVTILTADEEDPTRP